MKLNIALFCLSLILSLPAIGQENKPTADVYQYKVKLIDGKEISMKDYEGKVVLIVNTASKCGFTPQYQGLENLFKKFSPKGLVILGFPCNQFAGQEPGSAEEISKFCTLNYGVTFPMFSKIEVNGQNADPLYKYLKKALPGTLGNEIKWNFTKFLLDKKGKPFKRYAPATKPEEITNDIEKLLSEN
jgi:glutathione peroxidase